MNQTNFTCIDLEPYTDVSVSVKAFKNSKCVSSEIFCGAPVKHCLKTQPASKSHLLIVANKADTNTGST